MPVLPWHLCPGNRRGCWWPWQQLPISTLWGMGVMGMNMLCKPYNKRPMECDTIYVVITFSFWVIWVDYLGCRSSQSPGMVIPLLDFGPLWTRSTLAFTSCALFCVFGGPCPQVTFTFPASQYFRPLLIVSPNYLAFTKVRKSRQNFKSQLGYPFSCFQWPVRDHSFWPGQVPH